MTDDVGAIVVIHTYAHLTDTCQPVEVGLSGGGHVAEDCLVTVPGGVNSRLDELQAGFLRTKLPSLDLVNDRRRSIIQRYAEAAAGGPMTILPADGEQHVGHLAVARMADRSRGRAELSKRGVATDVHFPVLDYQQPGLKGEECFLPVSETAAEEVFSLPRFAGLTDDEKELIHDPIRPPSSSKSPRARDCNTILISLPASR